MTTSLLSPEQLRQQIRVRLAGGRLPTIRVGIYKTQRGTGRPCLVCRREIGSSETEYDVDGAGVVLIAHEPCYTLWREESAAEIDPGENRQPTVAGPRSGSSRVPRRGTRPTSP